MNIHNLSSKVVLLLLSFLVLGCDDFLEDGTTTEGNITEDQLWNNDQYARGVLNNAYFTLQDNYELAGGAMRASGSDEAVNSNPNSSINIFNNGTWSPNNTIDNSYGAMYDGLRKVNQFLERSYTSNIVVPGNASPSAAQLKEEINRLRGQAFFLRGYFHFELAKRYGGIVLATRAFDRLEELNLPRNSFEETVNHIVMDCDSAILVLPEWTNSWGGTDRGRATGTAAMALKSRILLYAASPLHNPANDVAKWQKAADAAKDLIDRNRHSLLNNYANIFNYGAAAYNAEVIFATQAPNRNDIEINNAPISYQGGALGRTNPTQELVDAFDMANGKPITDPTSGYDPNNPYASRDPRLAMAINYNGREFKNIPVQTYIGGKDGLNHPNPNSTKTGYYMRKFLVESVTWNVQNVTSVRRPWVIFRYAEILLNHAEALNEVQGPVAEVYARVNAVRKRAGVNLPDLPAGLSKEDMRARIMKERQVELCFEGHRFFDVRRWKLGEELFGRPVTGMRITLNNATFAYERFVVENRVFTQKHYLYPFPQSELNRASALMQNPFWN